MRTPPLDWRDHPLYRWVGRQHDGSLDSQVRSLRLRVYAERALLDRHFPVPSDSDEIHLYGVCDHCGERLPCLEWRSVASGYADRPGFDPDWLSDLPVGASEDIRLELRR